jgi:hypothetical protein
LPEQDPPTPLQIPGVGTQGTPQDPKKPGDPTGQTDPTKPTTDQLSPKEARITINGEGTIQDTIVHAKDVKLEVGEYVLTGGTLDGDTEKELIFSGNPVLTYRGQTVYGESIRFRPKTKEFTIDRPYSSLSPEFLKGKALVPIQIDGLQLYGQRNKPLHALDCDCTTCDRERPHYMLRAGEIRFETGKRVVLKKATLYLYGKRIITLPTLIIPLDRKLGRTGYTPQFGRSQDEGWFVKSAFDYLAADRVPGIFRVDLMEKKGVGLGVEQAWQLAKIGGALALYGIPVGNSMNNLSGRLNNRFNLGGGQTITLDNDFQQQSYLSLPGTTSFNSRFGFQRQADGFGTGFNLSRQEHSSTGFKTRSYTLGINQTAQLGTTGSLTFNTDYSRNATYNDAGTNQLTQQLNTRFQADQRAPNYNLQLVANRNVPVGSTTGQSFFGGVEKLPEVTLNNYKFTNGPLSRAPLTFTMSAGKYSEGQSGLGTGGPGQLTSERVAFGVDLNNSRTAISKTVDLNMTAGFLQYLYGEGAAQYIMRNNTTLAYHMGKRSGLSLNYTYQRPEGGTPFRFDQQGQYHTLNGDLGMLDDSRLQVTARVGYDFGRTNFGGFNTPWQTLSGNVLWRPSPSSRIQNLFTFDPNNGKFIAVTTDLRFRGRNDMHADIVTRFDPARHKFGNMNGYFNIPVGPWRFVSILQYNGYLNRFENQSLQIVRDLHCLEASFTYVSNPFGFRNDRQFYFNLRIKGLPFLDNLGGGAFGQALDTGIGGGRY